MHGHSRGPNLGRAADAPADVSLTALTQSEVGGRISIRRLLQNYVVRERHALKLPGKPHALWNSGRARAGRGSLGDIVRTQVPKRHGL